MVKNRLWIKDRMKKRLIQNGLGLFLAGCLALSSTDYYARGQEEKPAPSSENPAPTALKDDGLYQEVFRGNIKDPKAITKNPEKTIVNFISLYPEQRKERLEGTNLLERIMNGFEKEVKEDPLYLTRDRMWEPFPTDHESLDEVPYSAQLGKAVWDVFREDYGWAKVIDKGLKEVQKVTTVEIKYEKMRLRIKPLVENLNGEDVLKIRMDLLGTKFSKIDYIYSEIGRESATLDIGRHTRLFGENSEVYVEFSQNYDSGEFKAILYIEIPNLSFWKEESRVKNLNSRSLNNTGEDDEKSNQ
jgi:hypothetical protein